MLFFAGSFLSILTTLGTFILNVVLFKLPWAASKAAKFYNVLFLVLASLVAYGLSAKGHYIIKSPKLDGFKLDGDVFGFVVVFRVMLGAAIYHLAQGIALLGVNSTNDSRSIIQNGLWPVKFFVLIGCCVLAFYIPLTWGGTVFSIAVTGAIASTAIQAVLLIDAAYEYAEYLIGKYEETFNESYKHFLMASTVCFNLFIVGGSVFLLIKYQSTFEIVLVLCNLLSSWLMSVLSALESVQDINPRAGIFQSSLLGCYNTYLITSALLFRPGNAGSSASESWKETLLSVVGYFVAIVMVAFSAFRTGQASSKLLLTSHSKDLESTAAEGDEEADGEEVNEIYNRSFFHFIFLLAALQLAVQMNQWRVPVLLEDAKRLEIQDSHLGFWIKVGTSWGISCMYLWSLFAPYFFPDRDFF